jgi:hypothetical protein
MSVDTMPFRIGDRVLYRSSKNAQEFADRGVVEAFIQGRGPDRDGVRLDGGTGVQAEEEQLKPAPDNPH